MTNGSEHFDWAHGFPAKGNFVRDLQAITSSTVSRRKLLIGSGAVAGALAVGTLRIPVASAQDAVEVTIWSNHPEWIEPLTSLLEAFQTATPGVTMALTAIPGPDYPTKLQTALAGGQPPDVIGLQEGSILNEGSAAFPIVDLTGVVDASKLIDSARLQVEEDGKIFGVPLASYTVGLAVQNPIMAEQGATVPTTWDELKTTAQALLDAGVTPLIIGGRDGVHTFFMYIGLVSSILGPEGFAQLRAGERKLTDPDLLTAAQLLVDLKPFFNEGFEATDYVTSKALFAQGLGAMMVAGTADFTGFKEENPEADLGFRGLARSRSRQVRHQHRYGTALYRQQQLLRGKASSRIPVRCLARHRRSPAAGRRFDRSADLERDYRDG